MARRLWFGGLRWRLILWIAIAILPAIALLVERGLERRERAAADLRAQTLSLARLVAQEQARQVEGARQLLTALSTSSAFLSDDTTECVRDARALVRQYNLYSEIGWADRTGRVRCHALEGDNFTIAERQYFQAALATERFVVGELIIGKISHVPILAFAYPLREPDGRVRGVIFANIDLRIVARRLAEATRDQQDTISMFDRQGVVLARSWEAPRNVQAAITPEQLRVIRREGELVRSYPGLDGVPRQYAIATVRDAESETALFVSYGRAEEPLLASVTSRFQDDLLAVIVLAVGMLGAAWAGTEWLVRKPINSLLTATTSLAAGQLSTRATPVGSTTEFATLAAAFNQMAEKLEQRDLHLREGQRLEAIGQLAGGIAHDFNNLLTVIVGCGASIEEQVQDNPALAREVADLRAAADHAASLTRQLLAFSRRQLLQPRLLQLNDIVTELRAMLRRTIGDEIALDVALDPGLGLVRADPAQVEQVILNLLLNARDAMPEGGEIVITTRNRRIAAGDVQGAAAGDYVELSVSDNGRGMDAATRAHIFEPFFTTKGPRGTGLGLATVYGIVTQSGGVVRCDSTVGQGTRFEVLLPRAAGVLEPAAPAAPIEAPTGGSEHILVVEDEPAVRSLIVATLGRYGYAVSTAEDGLSALDLLPRVGPVHLLVTDVRMPRMSGLTLYERLREQYPDVPALLMSGDSAPDVPGDPRAGPRFLQKPFTPSELLQATREALAGRVPAAQ